MSKSTTHEMLNSDQIEVLASSLIRTVEQYFQDDEHKRQFEEWYKKKYGMEYKWR